MKILFIAKNIPIPGHSENDIIIRQAKVLKAAGHQVDIVYPREFFSFLGFLFRGRIKHLSKCANVFQVKEVSIMSLYYIRLPLAKSLEWKFSNLFIKNLNPGDIEKKFAGYDLIHSHFVFPDSILGNYLSKVLCIPHVVTIREGDYLNLQYSKVNKKLFQNAIDSATSIISMTPNLSRGVLLNNRSKIEYIPSFIDNSFFNKNSHECMNRTEDIRFLTISKLIKRKNLDWILEFFSNNKEVKATLSIYGDGELFDSLKRISKGDLRIKFHGYQNADVIIDALDSNDIFVLPSQNESFGLVYAEAAARRNVIVAHSGTGLSGINQDGFLFCENKMHFFNILKCLLSLDKQELESMKEKNYNYSRIFSSDNFVCNSTALYKKILKENLC